MGKPNLFVIGNKPPLASFAGAERCYDHNNSVEYATVAYASSGEPLWTNRFRYASNSLNYAKAIALHEAGTMFVTGTSINATNPGSPTLAPVARPSEMGIQAAAEGGSGLAR